MVRGHEARLRVPWGADGALVGYVVLLFVLPSGLVLGPLGAAGSPAALLGMFLFVWWVLAGIVPGLGVAAGLQPIRLALFAFQFAVGVSFLAGSLRPMTAEEASSSLRGVLSICAWSGVVLVAADGLPGRAGLERVLQALVRAGFFLAALGFIQFATGWNPASLIEIPGLTMNTAFGPSYARDNFTRVSGTATHAIEFGVVLAAILPLALHHCWYARRHRRFYRVGTVLIGMVLPMTVSRSAIVGTFIVLAVMFVSWPPARRARVLLALPFMLVVLKAAVPGLLGAFRNLFLNISGDPSTQGRTDDYVAVGRYVAENPWFGRGISTFIPELYRTLDNAYLGWLLEVGWFGLVTLVGLMLTAVVVCLLVRAHAPDEETGDLAAALLAGILSIAFNFATFDALGFAICAGVFFLLLGAVGALWRTSVGPCGGPTGPTIETRPDLDRRSQPRGLLGWSLIGALGAVVLAQVFGPQTVYQADGAVLLKAPRGSPGAINPYALAPYLDLSAEMAQRMVIGPATVARLRARGLQGEYTLASGTGSLMPLTDQRGRGPLIHIRMQSPTAAAALAGRDLVMRELGKDFTTAQLSAGSPSSELIRVVTTSRPTEATTLRGDRNRVLLSAFLLGWFTGRVGARTAHHARRGRSRSHD